jgi:hypothetical protein
VQRVLLEVPRSRGVRHRLWRAPFSARAGAPTAPISRISRACSTWCHRPPLRHVRHVVRRGRCATVTARGRTMPNRDRRPGIADRTLPNQGARRNGSILIRHSSRRAKKARS